ncbi:MAG TPA: NAD(P)/FAD-dependent oxidoreductase, partial [Candidatus Binatia bacterium]|nr:NAD(P)/FAD-dependent oxidoreductase [Candidatus Binatia bacterium]
MTSKSHPVSTNSTSTAPRFLIIGAGMSGILSAIKLREAGLDNFAIYEKADRLGGTWRENTYPGIACDVPSHFYCYSFALNPEWSHRFSPGAEIQAYFEDIAQRYGVGARIQYRKEITRCEFAAGRWTITMSDGSRDEGDFVIAATGVLHHPAYPDIAGLDTFAGAMFHSARWDHTVPLAGKRVGVIGTGSSAIQIVGALVDQVAELSLFQRTPQWIMPMGNPAYSPEEKAQFRTHPEAIEQLRSEVARMFTEGFANHLADLNSPQLQAIHNACVANLENSVKDPVLRERLRPNYRAACKRLIMSENFYDAIQRPNAKLVTEGIERIEKSGVRTRDGKLHELDVLVLATGFRVDRFMRPMEVVGRNGTPLEQVWKDGPYAYMAIAIPDFPNFFMLNGPNSPVGNFSLIEVAELQVSCILQLVEQVRSGTCRELSPS